MVIFPGSRPYQLGPNVECVPFVRGVDEHVRVAMPCSTDQRAYRYSLLMASRKTPLRKSTKTVPVKRHAPLYKRVQAILEQARDTAARSVNTAQVVANWLIGREIVEDEQMGSHRAGYGHRVLEDLSTRLHKEYGAGYSVNNLEHFRKFYLL